MNNHASSVSKPLRIAVGMSGGLDSSVAAALLMEQGHELVGFTAHLWAEGSRCCSLNDAMRARHVAQLLGFEHYVIDAVDFFGERIVDAFVEEYARGRTPSPCVLCNQILKFGLLLRDALEIGCTHIATGHYARIEHRSDGIHLLRGVDVKKDQSYFLHRLDQAQLGHVIFPLGNWTKEQTVEYAKSRNLPVPLESESQDLCFVKDDGYAPFLEKRRPELKQEGAVVDSSGQKVGKHEGFYRFTVGQREGVGIAAKERLYVKEVRADSNVVVVGTREEVSTSRCAIGNVMWIAGRAPSDKCRFKVKLRYRHAGAPGVVHLRGENVVEVEFDEPQIAVTPGQAAVFYDGDEVLGGGWIGGGEL
jgi:tRNA-specific 2-thiouridylase